MKKPSFCFITIILVLFQLMDNTMAVEGTCGNKHPVVKGFNLEKFTTGCWYYEEDTMPGAPICPTLRFKRSTSKNDTFESIFKTISASGKIMSINGEVTMDNPESGSFAGQQGGHFSIIDIDDDYTNAEVYLCTSTGIEGEFSMGRKKQPGCEDAYGDEFCL